MQVGRITSLPTGVPPLGKGAMLQATPRESGEISQEVQIHHDLVGRFSEELEMLEVSLAPVSQGIPPTEAKDAGVKPRYSSTGCQLQEDNIRMYRLIERVRAIRSNLVI